jgi:ferric-dicitrate binding protein FerR (iron transport regulator)
MSRPLEELLARYLEGEISPEDEASLLEVLRNDPRAADWLEAFLRLDEGLRQAIVPEASGDGIARAVAERLDKSGQTGFFARKVVDGIQSAELLERKKTRRHRFFRLRDRGPSLGAWAAALMAATGLFALLVLATVAGKGSGRPQPPVAEQPAAPRPPIDLAPEERPEPERRTLPPPAPARNRVEIEREVAALDEEKRVIEEKRERALKEAAEARRGELLRQAEAELAAVAARYREKVAELKLAEQAAAKAPPTAPTVAAPAPVARIERAEGVGFVLLGGSRVAAQAGRDVMPGQGLETVGAKSGMSVAFPDRTRVEVGGATEVREAGGARGKRLFVARGKVTAEVEKQPAGQPMVFETPHGEAVVLGTSLRLVVDAFTTRLEVKEGRVRFDSKDGKSVEVGADHFVTVSQGMKLSPRPLPIEEIVLTPREVRLYGPEGYGEKVLRQAAIPVGSDWKAIQDREAVSKVAFDAPLVWNGADTPNRQKSKRLMQSFVEFKFAADAEKEYTIWVRGCRGKKGDPEGSGTEWYRFDLVRVEVIDADGTRLHDFNGYGQKEGYWWVSGNADPSNMVPAGAPPDNPVTVKFLSPGQKVLRVYPIETPMRFDAVWLSATQKKRPPESQIGPPTK